MSAAVLKRVHRTCDATADSLDVAAAEVAGSDAALATQISITAATLRRYARNIRPAPVDTAEMLQAPPDERWGRA